MDACGICLNKSTRVAKYVNNISFKLPTGCEHIVSHCVCSCHEDTCPSLSSMASLAVRLLFELIWNILLITLGINLKKQTKCAYIQTHLYRLIYIHTRIHTLTQTHSNMQHVSLLLISITFIIPSKCVQMKLTKRGHIYKPTCILIGIDRNMYVCLHTFICTQLQLLT